MIDFGESDPREMPAHLFWRALRLDYTSAVRADPTRQNCSICPRYWYVDAAFACDRCASEFMFTTAEQRAWYEEYRFWIDSLPRHCLPCRRALREMKTARQTYDLGVARALGSEDPELTQRVVDAIDQLYELGGELPARITEHRRRLARQIQKGRTTATDRDEPTAAG